MKGVERNGRVVELLFFLVATLVLLGGASNVMGATPNFIIIMTDDQGYGDLGCYGAENLDTPNIDRMADEGLRLTNFYAGQSICTPSRAALMTGCYAQRVGLAKGVLFPDSKRGLNPSEITIASLLKTVGYQTACVGKWHLGDAPEFLPTNHGFDSYYGIPYSNDMPFVGEGTKGSVEVLDRTWEKHDESSAWWEPPLLEGEEEIEKPVDQTTITDRYTDRAVEFIESNREKPFFLYFSHTMPHVPLFVSKDRYDEDVEVAYASVINHIDDSVGRVLDAVRENGLSENTLVIFTSDNGPWLPKQHHAGSAGDLFGGKFSIHEGGFRVPCVVWAPGMLDGGKNLEGIVSSIDFYRTFANLARADVPEDRVIDSRDMWPYFLGLHSDSPRETFFYFSKDGELDGIRDKQWKLTRIDGKTSLYDLKLDQAEANDVYDSRPDIAYLLEAKLGMIVDLFERNKRPVGTVE